MKRKTRGRPFQVERTFMWFCQAHLAPWPVAADLPLIAELGIYQAPFLCQVMLVPQAAVVSKKDVVSTLKKFITWCSLQR